MLQKRPSEHLETRRRSWLRHLLQFGVIRISGVTMTPTSLRGAWVPLQEQWRA